MDNYTEAQTEALMIRTALQESSREADEQALISDALRLSLQDTPIQTTDEDVETQTISERERESNSRAEARAAIATNSASHHMAADDPYPHDELPGPDYIRILNVLPSDDFHETIVCSIEPVPLDKSSFYFAVSYSWALNETGDASRRRAIVIDGTVFRVTQNLFDCLLRVRDRRRPRRLWVDAVCINQLDPMERSSQVARMAQIYQNADTVLVWLGEGAAPWEDKIAFDAVRWFSMHSGRIARNRESGWNDEDGDRILADLGLYRTESGAPAWQPVLEALNKLWDRRYFSRRWIVQELAYAPSGSLRILWGPHRCSYGDFVDGADQACSIALEMINGAEGALNEGNTAVEYLASETIRLTQRVRDVAHFHNRPTNGERQDICYALSHCNPLRCMDDRDILYALAKLDTSFDLEPDYMASIAEVYVRFARKLLDMSLLEQLLANTSRSRAITSSLELPSWVPDLRSPFIDVGMSTTSLATSVDDSNTLKCELYCLGTVSNEMQMNEGIIILLSLGFDSPQKIKIAPHQRHVKPGDLACCAGWAYGRRVVFLRPSRQFYKIVHVMGQNFFTPVPFVDAPTMTKTVFEII